MKKNIFIPMAVAGIMVFNMGLSGFAEELSNSDEPLIQIESDSALTNPDENIPEVNTETEAEPETETEKETETEAEPETETEVNDSAENDTTDVTEDNTDTTIENNDNDENGDAEITDDNSKDEGKKTDKTSNKESNQQEKLDAKDKKIEAAKRLREIKLLTKAAKIESLTYIKEVRALFKDVDKADRKEVLAELAAIKDELKDFSIDSFVKGICIDFEKYDNVKPVIENGRTLAPIRAIIEALGADVQWDGETQEITITADDIVVVLTIGSNVAYVNDVEAELDTAPEIRNGRTLVPVRFLAESFNLNVDWDDESNSIIID